MIEENQLLSFDKAKQIGDTLGIDWNLYAIEEFQMGLEVELDHGVKDPTRKFTHEDLLFIGKIAWAHLTDNADYYTRFEKIG